MKKGFTLTEVLISFALMSMVAAAAFKAVQIGYATLEGARDQTRVTQIIQSEIEGLRTLNWTDLTALPEKAEFQPEGNFIHLYGDRYTCYRFIETVRADMREVRVRVVWDQGSRPQQQEFVTRFTRNGLNDYYYRAF